MTFTNHGFDVGVYDVLDGETCDYNDWERAYKEGEKTLNQCSKPAVVLIIISFGLRQMSVRLCEPHKQALIEKLGAG